MRVGFIGLGMMGKGMAANLQKAGFGLCGTPRSAGETDSFARGPPNQ
jgi:3-hydroxyisobutyrate dehydrogenase-like beta-hydroxyacid dehydrogenase